MEVAIQDGWLRDIVIQMEADYQAGMVVFNGEVELTPLQRRMAEGHDQMLTIDWGDYAKHKWNILAATISSITANKLLIWNNWHPSILVELKHVSFANLTQLVIRSNRIVSLECLVKMDVEKLQQLDVADNLIVSTRSLSKVSMKSLQTLNISHNPILIMEHLYKGNFPILNRIDIYDAMRLLSQFYMANDPVTWKLKMQRSFPEDQNFFFRHGRRGFRQYGQNYEERQTGLDYSKIKQMLSKKR